MLLKKFGVLVFIVALLALAAAGCGQEAETPGSGEESLEGESFTIGIVQIVEHPALDASREGFLAGLAEAGYKEGENLTVQYHSAQGDQSIALTIAQNLVNDGVDLILGIATPAAQAAVTAAAGSGIPVLFTAVTDPVDAELVNSWEAPGVNVTGTSDLNPVEDQIELIRTLNPDVKTIGTIYNPGEPNSVVQVELVRAKVEAMGLALEEAPVTNSSEVAQAAQSLVGKVEAIYVPTDNTAVQALATILQVAEENDILVVAGEGDSVKSGAVATVGIDYYTLGFETGLMAARVLEGADPATMAVVKGMDLGVSYTVNLAAAERMGVVIPEEILDKAEVVEE